MKETAEYLTSNRLVRYPFADDTTLSVGDRLSSLLFGCFVDALVQLKPGYQDITPYIKDIGIQGHTLEFVLSGPSDMALRCTRSREQYPVIQGESKWCWYTFVLSSDGIRDLEGSWHMPSTCPDVIQLSPRCIGVQPKGVTSIGICGGTKEKKVGDSFVRLTLQEALEDDPDVVLDGDLSLAAGYNTVLSQTTDGLTISAIPGAGSGTAPCPCQKADIPDMRKGIWSTDGHIRLFNDTCYDFVHDTDELYDSTFDVNAGRIEIHAKCKACCTCEMYGSIVNGRLVPIKDAVISAQNKLNGSLKAYENAVSKWNKRVDSVLPEDIVMTMTAIPLDSAGTQIGGGGVAGRMSRCGYSATVRNDSFVDVTISVDSISSNGSIFQQTISYMNGGTPVVLQSTLGQRVLLNPGKSLLISYFVRSDGYAPRSSRSGFSSTVKISAYHGDELITSKSKVVNT